MRLLSIRCRPGWLLPVFCALLWALAAVNARAEVTCTATMTELNFGVVELVDGGAPGQPTATLDYECTNDDNQRAQARVCFNIGDGDQGLGNFNPRVMTNAGGDPLRFQLYQGATGTIWGSNGRAEVPNPFIVELEVPRHRRGADGRATGSATMRGRLLGGQGTAPPGDYQDNFGGPHTSITLSWASGNGAPPATCGTMQSDKFEFIVRAKIDKSCVVSADPLDFGSVDGLPTTVNVDGQSAIRVTCTRPTPYTVALAPQNNATNGAGVMTSITPGNTDTVPYRLYRDPARSNAWGNVVGSNTAAEVGTGTAQTLTVYGRVPAANVTPGSYRDTVTVLVRY